MQQNPRLTEMLVKKLMRKYNVDPGTLQVSDEDRELLQSIIQEIQGEVNQFLEDQQAADEGNTTSNNN
ncbi:hypothetical protein [Salibacterium halotolerans]|uniref:Spore coat protein W n=1 Tax=Salibacterium halotolerans TaxID=1884432 RepID=A0A1I5XI37_9BACI|nr:hypothetical protein [Salibacterium halotolerans]SFQ31621.1 hypothetical protein SAMN05518683_12821 [Salibacterium halotolerans]